MWTRRSQGAIPPTLTRLLLHSLSADTATSRTLVATAERVSDGDSLVALALIVINSRTQDLDQETTTKGGVVVDIEGLRVAVIRAANHWDELLDKGDPNRGDVYLHARRIEASLGEGPPASFPSRDEGVCIVEAVERHFIANSIIRFVGPEVIGYRAKALVEFLQAHNLISSPGFADMYVAALYAWHGCVGMAKLLRNTYLIPEGGELPYTQLERLHRHGFILSCPPRGEPRGHWVQFGMSLAKPFEGGRGRADRDIHDEWVPKDSPYWQG